MRLRLSRGEVAFIVFVGVALVGLLFGLGLPSFGRSQPHLQPTATPTPTNNPIVRENALPGTNGWQIPKGNEATRQIQAYASATSVLPVQKLTFYVSTQIEGTSYSIGFYQLGWYGGLGGRLMALQANQIGHAQGYYNESDHH